MPPMRHFGPMGASSMINSLFDKTCQNRQQTGSEFTISQLFGQNQLFTKCVYQLFPMYVCECVYVFFDHTNLLHSGASPNFWLQCCATFTHTHAHIHKNHTGSSSCGWGGGFETGPVYSFFRNTPNQSLTVDCGALCWFGHILQVL